MNINSNIPPLTADNWLSWSALFESKMQLLQLADALNDTRTVDDFPNRLMHLPTQINYQEWRETSQNCLAHMKLTVGEEFLSVVIACETAAQAWNELRKRVNSLSQLGTTALYSNLMSTKKSIDEPFRTHLDKMNRTRQLLASLGEEHKISDVHWMNIIINSVPVTYEFESTIIALGRSMITGRITIDDVTNQFTEAERVHKASKQHESQQAALYSSLPVRKITLKRDRSAFEGPQGGTSKCDYCGKSGHTESECFKKPGQEDLYSEYRKKTRRQKASRATKRFNNVAPQATSQVKSNSTTIEADWPYSSLTANVSVLCCTSTTVTEPNSNWYVDSAASRHFAYSKDVFVNLRPIDKVNVRFGNSGTLAALGVGDVSLVVRSNGEQHTIHSAPCDRVIKNLLLP
jgi:hypothetical protein